MTRQNYQAIVCNVLRFAPRLILVALALTSVTGCSNRTTAVALGTLVGVGLGAPLTTHSKVDVQVEVFNAEGIEDKFTDQFSPLAVRFRDCQRQREQAKIHQYEQALALPQVRRALTKLDEVTPLADMPDPVEKSTSRASAPLRVESYRSKLSVSALPKVQTMAKFDVKLLRNAAGNASNSAAERDDLTASARIFDALSTGSSSGPLADEVMQVVLTKGSMLDCITKTENQDRWRPFSSAVSEGGAGDHHAVIYLENMGFPVLKSAKFDPSAFVRAFGKVYQVAFNATAQALGVPAAGSTGSTEGLDSFSSDYRKRAADKKAADARAQLYKTIEQLADVYKDKPKVDANNNNAVTNLGDLAAEMTKLADALDALNAK